eukprot:CAMPEP_0118930636 /NCGR_PEP_ID=MMETSP1169-20130426/7251_1 /TAXON_ID=36882 /ORGANISM="Pyramimonas obovata, Strain CCMP722" /LENGTH=105 /DNA_ID=CAMNT_0006873019 /DNA_START=999 /DNA_END=1316 /DNA_ORIENTATION=-
MEYQGSVVDKVRRQGAPPEEAIHLASDNAALGLGCQDRLCIWVTYHFNIRILVIKAFIVYGGDEASSPVLTYEKVHVWDSLSVSRQYQGQDLTRVDTLRQVQFSG